MSAKWVSFAGLFLLLEENWYDVTEDLPEDSPFTLAKSEDGLGALQFSVGLYRSGPSPEFNEEKLKRLLFDFFESKDLGDPHNYASWQDGQCGVCADCSREDEYFRIWYVSDGRNVAFVTFTSLQVEDQGLKAEVSEAETIVRSIRFEHDGAAEGKGP